MYELTLNDFEYEINGDNLIFKKILNEEEKDIKLLDKYTIDGKDYIMNEIGYEAFAFSEFLNIELPDTIDKIEDNAFMCTNIKKFVIPPKVTVIPFGCFSVCEGLVNVQFHDNITEIKNGAFYGSGIKKITIPPKVKEINDECFNECENLKEIVLHDNITKLGDCSFCYCKFEKFVVPPKVTVIPRGCFLECENLNEVILHDNIVEIGNSAFSNTKIQKFECPIKVTVLPENCFDNCTKLKEIELNNVKYFNKNVFKNCKKINISYQNYKDIYIDDYEGLVGKGFIDTQINQILKGYKKQVYLNYLHNNIPVDIFRIIVNNFDKDAKQFSDIIKQLENKKLSLNDNLKIYCKIRKMTIDTNLNDKEIDHTI